MVEAIPEATQQEPLQKREIIIGIDVGTSNFVLAYCQQFENGHEVIEVI